MLADRYDLALSTDSEAARDAYVQGYRVCRDGGAMYQLLDIAAGYAGLPQYVRDTSEDRLGVIAARR